MSKRFIDTALFDDDWFMDLSKEAKLLWIYMITKCDHAGILKLNLKLCTLQTDIKDLNKIIKELGNRLVTVSKDLYFIPKFLEFQYPGFPNSKVRQQSSAVDILTKYGLFDNGKLTVSKELTNTYENDNDNVNDIVNDNYIYIEKEEFNKFWNLYDKKVGDKEKLFKKWLKLDSNDKVKIFETLPVFLSTVKEKQYQPYPETYLNNKRWNDEITQLKSYSPHQPAPR